MGHFMNPEHPPWVDAEELSNYCTPKVSFVGAHDNEFWRCHNTRADWDESKSRPLAQPSILHEKRPSGCDWRQWCSWPRCRALNGKHAMLHQESQERWDTCFPFL